VQKLYSIFLFGLDNSKRYTKSAFGLLVFYFSFLSANLHNYLALFGFYTFAIIFNQLISGIMLSFSFIPEPMYVSLVREEEDLEDLYTDHFFWLHERGVDLLFVFVFAHLLRKLYLISDNYEQEFAWKSGTITFLVLQVVVFLGLVLCGTHLSEITLTIAANALYTFFMFIGKPYWWFFTDLCLNADTLLRMAYAHYVSAFFVTVLAIIHGYDMHYDWKQENTADGVYAEATWWDEVAANELSILLQMLLLVYMLGAYLYSEPEPLAYEIFMWGDIGVSTDIRFYGVAPHWYFRPYMAWLIVCPSHRTGLFGLIFFFVILYYQPNLHANYYKNIGKVETNNNTDEQPTKMSNNVTNYYKSTFAYAYQPNLIQLELSHLCSFFIFFGAILYVCTFLPFGRFYNRVGGNVVMLYAYLYIFIYLSIPEIKKVIVPLYFAGLKSKITLYNTTTNSSFGNS
jgi:quinol-cytochrome oxidoreductase complex cytochrome b subunit